MMFDARRLLDAVVGALAQGGTAGGGEGGSLAGAVGALAQGQAAATMGQVLGQASQGLRGAAQQIDQATGLGTGLDQAARISGAESADQLLHKAREFMGQNPGMTQASLAGVAGLLLASKKGRGIAANLAALGGLALVGSLAYKAYQNHQAGRPLLDVPQGGGGALPPQAGSGQAPQAGSGQAPQAGSGQAPTPEAPPSGGAASALGAVQAAEGQASPAPDRSAPDEASFHPVSATEDDVLLYLRAMVAAAACDGTVDANERSRLMKGLEQAGIDAQATGWLERELAEPATVDELADAVQTPEKAAQVYTAARVAISADTMQEQEFLRQLAEALDVDPGLRREIDASAETLRAQRR